MTASQKLSPFHVSVFAESITAALFARCGYDISVQYGANQPEYDLIVAKGEKILKVSVKGSQDGGWGLTQKHKKANITYHDAIDLWLLNHTNKTVFSLVQLLGTTINDLPNVYLATPLEISDFLKRSSNGRGETVLRENKIWTNRANGAGTIDKIPDSWKFSQSRVDELIEMLN